MLSVDYQYDGNGNRIKKTEGERETRYRYNQKNQLFQKEDGDGISCFTYDRQGGIIEEKTAGGICRFTYNSLHQQTQVETETGNIQKNRYDAEGLRYELIENGRRTSFVYHNGELLHEKGGEAGLSKEATSYHLGAGIEAFQRDSKTYYYHQDEQLNTTLITDEERKLRNHYQYDAFGAGLEAAGALPNRIRYTGQQYDEQTEQYYLRARYYNPVLGRFMQEDVYQGDGLNLYAYCANNPVVYYDPSGYNKNVFGDADYQGVEPTTGWQLAPDQDGAHMIEKGSITYKDTTSGLETTRSDLKFFKSKTTCRYFPNGSIYNAGEAHRRMHEQTRKNGVEVKSDNFHLSDVEMLLRFDKAYSAPELQEIRGTVKNGYKRKSKKVHIADNLPPHEAYRAILKDAYERDTKFRNFADNNEKVLKMIREEYERQSKKEENKATGCKK